MPILQVYASDLPRGVDLLDNPLTPYQSLANSRTDLGAALVKATRAKLPKVMKDVGISVFLHRMAPCTPQSGDVFIGICSIEKTLPPPTRRAWAAAIVAAVLKIIPYPVLVEAEPMNIYHGGYACSSPNDQN